MKRNSSNKYIFYNDIQPKNNTLLYDIDEVPATWRELLIYALQQLMAVFVATVLIANICGTPVSSCLCGAGAATIIYQLITGFKSPMFISSCGATCSAVIGALAMSNGDYMTVIVGGAIIFVVYALFAFILKRKSKQILDRIFPATIVGPVTMVIGLNLAGFIPTYVQVNGSYNIYGTLVAIVTMAIVAATSHYGKGFLKTIPFLIGLLAGYAISVVLTLTGVCKLIDFTVFKFDGLFALPDFTFAHASLNAASGKFFQILALFLPVAICAMLEHYSDHKVLSNIIGTDLTEKPGLWRTLLGDGAASFFGTIVCGLPNTSYGESIATTGFSRVASVSVISTAAIMLIVLSVVKPVQAFIASVPSCVFGGCAMILYGYIVVSGLKTLINSGADFNNNRTLVVVSVILTVGVSGIWLFDAAFAGVSLAMVLGVVLNLALKEKKNA